VAAFKVGAQSTDPILRWLHGERLWGLSERIAAVPLKPIKGKRSAIRRSLLRIDSVKYYEFWWPHPNGIKSRYFSLLTEKDEG